MKFLLKPFTELTVRELFEIYHLRSAVFVVEQNCAYLDPDDKDLCAWHVLMMADQTLAGYARILPPGVSYNEPSMGRVLTAPVYRGSGKGKELMRFSINATRKLFSGRDIVISAQSYLLKFYGDFGFVAEGEEYMEDNIPHTKMRNKA